MKGILSSLLLINTAMNESHITDHARDMMFKIVPPMDLGPVVSESVEDVNVGVVKFLDLGLVEIDAADEDEEVFVRVGGVVHEGEGRFLARGVHVAPLARV
jgi:hypothetical protein